MATVHFTVPRAGNGAAFLQAQVGRFKQAMLDAGCVLTTDTGQIDVTVDVVPATATGAALLGYNMFEVVDHLTPELRFLVKVEYWRTMVGNSSTYSSVEICHRVSIGSNTDGAGNFTSPSVVVTTYMSGNGGGSASTAEGQELASCVSLVDGYLSVLVGVGFYAYQTTPLQYLSLAIYSVGRSRTISGQPSADALYGVGPTPSNTGISSRHITACGVIPAKGVYQADSGPVMPAFSGNAAADTRTALGVPQWQFSWTPHPVLASFQGMALAPGYPTAPGDRFSVEGPNGPMQFMAAGPSGHVAYYVPASTTAATALALAIRIG